MDSGNENGTNMEKRDSHVTPIERIICILTYVGWVLHIYFCIHQGVLMGLSFDVQKEINHGGYGAVILGILIVLSYSWILNLLILLILLFSQFISQLPLVLVEYLYQWFIPVIYHHIMYIQMSTLLYFAFYITIRSRLLNNHIYQASSILLFSLIIFVNWSFWSLLHL